MAPAPITAIVFTSIHLSLRRYPCAQPSQGKVTRRRTSAFGRKKPSGIIIQNFAPRFFFERQGHKFVDIFFYVWNSGPGPICSPENFIGDFLDTRNIRKYALRSEEHT